MSKDVANPYEFNKLTMVDEYTASSGWSNIIKEADEQIGKHNWQSKESKLYWRGAANGKAFRYVDQWTDPQHHFPRVYLVVLGSVNPDYIDSKFVI